MFNFNRNTKISSIIYIVDDNELDLKVLAQEFELRTNYHVKAYTSGESFLKDLISNPPDKKQTVIIILDYALNTINIDAKNGIELLKTVKEINREYEVILISKTSDQDMITTALHFGAVNIVKKNENVYLRLQNNIKWILSQRDLRRKRLEMIKTIISFLIILFLVTMIAFFSAEISQF
ncbi:MAG: response regulator [Bacteroidales bacterium]|nr:response regulator [Bacteroidales bacterium]